MRISNENIEYNTVRLIKEIVGIPFEYSQQSDDSDHLRLITLGYISGVLDMADTMKEVLKA